uniref:Uncharacterized protein n=1 Tax=Anguilla anguilla TaxID=7936 RepID=A0A0E9ULX3_ANGAN
MYNPTVHTFAEELHSNYASRGLINGHSSVLYLCHNGYHRVTKQAKLH